MFDPMAVVRCVDVNIKPGECEQPEYDSAEERRSYHHPGRLSQRFEEVRATGPAVLQCRCVHCFDLFVDIVFRVVSSKLEHVTSRFDVALCLLNLSNIII